MTPKEHLYKMLEPLVPKEINGWHGSHFYVNGKRLWIVHNYIKNIFWIHHLPLIDVFKDEYSMEDPLAFVHYSLEDLFKVNNHSIYTWGRNLKKTMIKNQLTYTWENGVTEAMEFIVNHSGRASAYTEERFVK